MDKKFAFTVPDDLDSVCEAAVTDPMVSSLPDSPLAFQFVNVLVVPAVNRIDVAPVALYVLVILPNVFAPVMVNAPAPPWFSVMPEREAPPPAKVFAEALVRLMVPVPLTVPEVDVNAAPVPVRVTALEPILNVAVESKTLVKVTEKFEVAKVVPEPATKSLVLVIALDALNVPVPDLLIPPPSVLPPVLIDCEPRFIKERRAEGVTDPPKTAFPNICTVPPIAYAAVFAEAVRVPIG
jgi:hypothetical protein